MFVESEGGQFIDRVDSKCVDEYLNDLFTNLKNTEYRVFTVETTDPIFNKFVLKKEYDGYLYSPIIDDINTFEQYDGTGQLHTAQ